MNICCVTCAFLSQTKFKPSASVFLTRTVVLLRLSCDMAMCAESQSGAQAAIVKEKFFVFPVMHTSAGIQRELVMDACNCFATKRIVCRSCCNVYAMRRLFLPWKIRQIGLVIIFGWIPLLCQSRDNLLFGHSKEEINCGTKSCFCCSIAESCFSDAHTCANLFLFWHSRIETHR